MSVHRKPRVNIKNAICLSHDVFYRAVLEGTGLSDAERKLARSFLSDPLWRPLCELSTNGFTSFEGALMLLGADMISTDAFTVRKGKASAMLATTCDLTVGGRDYLETFLGAKVSDARSDFAFEVMASFQEYAAIDSGAGLVATRSALETALEFEDWEILKRLRDLPSGFYRFQTIAEHRIISKKEREEYMEFTTTWETNRAGSDVIDLNVIDAK